MSPISLALNLLLAGLLLMTLMFGWILNRRLKALKDSHAGFADAVGDLDRAAQRAETGLMELRATTDQAVEVLTNRIEKARELADRLETATLRAENAEKSVLARSAQARDTQVRDFRAREAQTRPASRPSESRAAPARESPVRSIFDRTRPAAPPPTFRQTSEEEAEAAAEALILRLSESEVLTTNAPPPREDRFAARARSAERPMGRDRAPARDFARDRDPDRGDPRGERSLESLFDRAPRSRDESYRGFERDVASEHISERTVEGGEEPRAASRLEPRIHPRSRAQIDDELFEPAARSGRLRAFDGGLS